MEAPPAARSATRIYLTRDEARRGCEVILEGLFGNLDRDCALLASLRETAIDKVLNSGYALRADGTYDVADLAGATLAWLRASERRHMPPGAVYEAVELSHIAEIYAACAAAPKRAEAAEEIAKTLLEQAHAARKRNVDVDTELRRCQSCVSTAGAATAAAPRLPCRHLADLLPTSIEPFAPAGWARTIVIFYSRTGTTRRVASDLASLLSCEIVELYDAKDRSGTLGYLRCLRDAMLQSRNRYGPALGSLRGYDLVVIGTPVWAATMSTPVFSFLHDRAAEFRKVAFFGTYGGSGVQRAFTRMQAIAGREPLATRGFTQAELRGPGYREALIGFVTRLERAMCASVEALST